MSSSNRTSSKGGKNKGEKVHKTDKLDAGRSSVDKHATKDQGKSDENLDKKVQQLIEMTQRSEEEVCLALQECNYDIQRAANSLFETTETQWSIQQKKKNRQPNSKQDKQSVEESAGGGGDDWNNDNHQHGSSDQKERPRTKSGGGGGPPGRRYNSDNRGGDGGGGRGWRGREKHENERNLDHEGSGRNDYNRERRPRPGGPGSGRGRGGRGGGRTGGGRYPPRGGNRGNSYNKPIDTWDNNSNTWDNNTVATTAVVEENWDEFSGTDEWTTEEYTGSLADTKVFTPSAQTQIPLDAQIENQHEGPLDVASQQLGQTLQINQQNVGGASVGQLPPQSPVPMMGALNPAQTKYFNQLTHNNSMQAFMQGYINAQPPPSQQQTLRPKTQRARVPPPSKIPSSAVEMPGELNSSVGYLDVQFGAMDFMSDAPPYDGVVESKYSSGNPPIDDVSAPNSNQDGTPGGPNANLDVYTSKTNAQSSISSALNQTLPSVDNIPTSEHVSGTGTYSVTSRTSAAQPAAPQTVLDMGKQSDTYGQNSSYNAYQGKSYNSNYNASQTTAANSYQSTNNYVSNQTASYGGQSTNNYQNSYPSATSYQPGGANSSAFPSITQGNTSYVGTNQSYVHNASQSVYGGNSGLTNSATYGTTASSSQYNNYSSTTNKLKEADYGGGAATATSSQATTPSTGMASSSTSISLAMSSSSSSSSKTTNALAAKNSGNIVSNVPPGVAAPVMSTPYNMVQVPYFQQPLYSYEDVQLLQQRIPHITPPFYDMSYQTPTTLAAVRDATLGNVGYSISDARFARSDNNASPVPSTLSQQTSTQAGHQAQPMLAGAAAAPYFFTTHFNTIPNYPFYQLPAATNAAHGTNNNSQYPKPGGYSSAYTYDGLGQNQDYGKGAYVGNAQAQKGSGATASSSGSAANDLTAAMYGKSHTALGKVNSYEKQGFHSGTPPPFTGTLHGNQNAGLAPSGTGYAPPVYIQAMAPHQHSTQLLHQPLHQESGNNGGQRTQSSNQSKTTGKQYPGSYWTQS